MDNSSYRSQYIQSGNENFSEQSVSVYDAFWKRLEKAERSIGKSLEDGYTTEEYAILIGKMNVSNQMLLPHTKAESTGISSG